MRSEYFGSIYVGCAKLFPWFVSKTADQSISRLTLQYTDIFLRDESPTVASKRLERSIAKSFTTQLEMHSRSYDVRNGRSVGGARGVPPPLFC